MTTSTLLSTLNALAAVIVSVVGFLLFSIFKCRSNYSFWGLGPTNRGTAYAALFLGIVASLSALQYLIRALIGDPPVTPIFFSTALDAVGNGFLAHSAYAMWKGEWYVRAETDEERKNDNHPSRQIAKDIWVIWGITAAAVVWDLVFGLTLKILERETDQPLLLYLISPNIVLAANAFVILGVASIKRFKGRAFAFAVLMLTYAVLQLPAYGALYFNVGSANAIKPYLVAGKFCLGVSFLVLFLPISRLQKFFDKLVRIIISLYSIATALKDFWPFLKTFMEMPKIAILVTR